MKNMNAVLTYWSVDHNFHTQKIARLKVRTGFAICIINHTYNWLFSLNNSTLLSEYHSCLMATTFLKPL